MRILYVNSSGQVGGAERLLLDLFAALRARHPDWALNLIALEPGAFVDAARALNVTSDILPLPPALSQLGEAGLSPAAVLGHALGSTAPLIGYLRRFRDHVSKAAPALVHSNGIKTHLLSAVALGRPTPVIWHVHDYIGARRGSARMLGLAARRCDLAVAVSTSVAHDLARTFGTRFPVVVVPNGVDVEAMSADGPAIDLDAASGLAPAPAGTIRVGLVATFARWKGQDVFLEAMAQLPSALPVRAYIVGGPIYQTSGSQFSPGALVERAGALGLGDRVGFTGFQTDRAAIFRSLDVVVHASTAPEPFGLVIAEAMAAGRPVITTGLGGAREVVRPGTDALLWDVSDPGTLAAAIARLAQDGNLRASMGRRGREAATVRFSRDRMADDMIAAYAQAAGAGR